MSIIAVSRGSFTRGSAVARLVAKNLGYRCVAREVLLEASSRFNIPEAKLVRAVAGSLSFLDRITGGRHTPARAMQRQHRKTPLVILAG